jgi:O-antigen ligase
MLNSFKRFQNAKTFKELIAVMTWKDMDLIAAIPVMLFMISPVIFFWQITFIKSWIYEITVNSLMAITAIFSVIVMSCDYSKQFLSGKTFRKMISDYLPQVLFLLMAVLIIISTFINGFTEYAVHGDLHRGESVFSFLGYILCFFGCAAVIRYERTKKFILNAFLIASGFISAVALLDYYGIIPVWHFHQVQKNAMCAVFNNSNHFGYYLAIAVTVSFAMCLFEDSLIFRVLYMISVSLHTFTLIINKTRGSYLACLAAVIVTCLVYVRTRKARLTVLLPVLAVFIASTAAGLLIVPRGLKRFLKLFRDVSDITASEVYGDTEINTDRAGSGRWILWKLTVGAILQKPVFGWGTEGISNLLTSSRHNNRPHNEYLEYAAFYGIPACLSYLAAVTNIYYRAIRKLSELSCLEIAALMGALTYLISACFGNTMFYTTPFLFILLGLGFHTGSTEQSAS